MSNSSLLSGLSEASGVRFSLVEVSQESVNNSNTISTTQPIERILKAFFGGSKSSFASSIRSQVSARARLAPHSMALSLGYVVGLATAAAFNRLCYIFFRLYWETSTFKNYHSGDSGDSGSRKIEFSSKSATFLH